jgi:hypothetical protein
VLVLEMSDAASAREAVAAVASIVVPETCPITCLTDEDFLEEAELGGSGLALVGGLDDPPR